MLAPCQPGQPPHITAPIATTFLTLHSHFTSGSPYLIVCGICTSGRHVQVPLNHRVRCAAREVRHRRTSCCCQHNLLQRIDEHAELIVA